MTGIKSGHILNLPTTPMENKSGVSYSATSADLPNGDNIVATLERPEVSYGQLHDPVLLMGYDEIIPNGLKE